MIQRLSFSRVLGAAPGNPVAQRGWRNNIVSNFDSMRVTRSTASLSIPLDETPSTFNGGLAHFQYGSVTANTSHGEGVNTASIEVKSSIRRSPLKRDASSIGSEEIDSGDASQAPTPTKKRRQSSKYAPPSKYAHLAPLTDILQPNLIAVFVGFNPGVRTATVGHAYAHPSNLFWKLLHSSGVTDRRWHPEEDVNLPAIGLGNTNLVERPTKDAGEMSKQEMAAGAPILEEKVRRHRPEAVCIVGKSIWEAIWRHKYGRNQKPAEFRYGWQDESENMGRVTENKAGSDEQAWDGARVFVATSTSGLSASLRPAEKEAIWKPFGDWVKQRRQERVPTPCP